MRSRCARYAEPRLSAETPSADDLACWHNSTTSLTRTWSSLVRPLDRHRPGRRSTSCASALWRSRLSAESWGRVEDTESRVEEMCPRRDFPARATCDVGPGRVASGGACRRVCRSERKICRVCAGGGAEGRDGGLVHQLDQWARAGRRRRRPWPISMRQPRTRLRHCTCLGQGVRIPRPGSCRARLSSVKVSVAFEVPHKLRLEAPRTAASPESGTSRTCTSEVHHQPISRPPARISVQQEYRGLSGGEVGSTARSFASFHHITS